MESKGVPVDEMNTIPPRLNELEREVHTISYRVSSLEESHKDAPVRLSRLESSVARLPEIERQLYSQGDQIRKGFNTVNGILLGAGAVWFIFQAGPQVMSFLGAK